MQEKRKEFLEQGAAVLRDKVIFWGAQAASLLVSAASQNELFRSVRDVYANA